MRVIQESQFSEIVLFVLLGYVNVFRFAFPDFRLDGRDKYSSPSGLSFPWD